MGTPSVAEAAVGVPGTPSATTVAVGEPMALIGRTPRRPRMVLPVFVVRSNRYTLCMYMLFSVRIYPKRTRVLGQKMIMSGRVISGITR